MVQVEGYILFKQYHNVQFSSIDIICISVKERFKHFEDLAQAQNAGLLSILAEWMLARETTGCLNILL